MSSQVPTNRSMIKKLIDDVQEIKDALIGTEYQKGRLHQIDIHEKRLATIERIVWIGFGVALVANAVVFLFFDIIK